MNSGNKILQVSFIFTVLFVVCFSINAADKPDLSQNFEMISSYPDQGAEINTLRAELFFVKNDAGAWARMSPFYRTFYQQRTSGSIQVLPGKPELKYNLWMQDKPADMVVIIPGTGENFVDLTPTAFADMYYQQGYSAVIISNAFNWEFMQAAGSVLAPGYTPVDAKDVKNALDLLLRKLKKDYPSKIRRKILIGSSMGALHTLFIADMNYKAGDQTFSRYIAINPPVDLLFAMRKIDEFYAVGAKWKKKEVQEKVRKCVLSYMRMLRGIDPGASPIAGGINRRQEVKMSVEPTKTGLVDFEKEEAQFLVGLSFHMNLMEVIYSIYSRHNTGVIKAEKSWFDRREIYAEIDKFNFNAYLHKFLLVEYEKRLGKKFTAEDLGRNAGLKPIAKTLKEDSQIRVIHNADDILLRKGDLAWLKQQLGDRIKIFAHGGHLGNLYTQPVKNTLLQYAGKGVAEKK